MDPIFELSTLPFPVHSLGGSQRLACAAEPLYRRALSRATALPVQDVRPLLRTGVLSS